MPPTAAKSSTTKQPAAEKPRRRTQEERRTATRTALLDATIDCLVEFGYADTTTTRVVERAGVSRGAQVHHFPTKSELVAEAVRHLTQRRTEEILKRVDKLPEDPDERLEKVLDQLWKTHEGPLFTAAIELWVAARTDEELRRSLVAVERGVKESVFEGAEVLFGARAADPQFQSTLLVALASMRGLALQNNVIAGDRRTQRARWKDTRERLLTLFRTPLDG